MARPFIPWVGGKEKLIPYIISVFPTNVTQYVEPFGGGGSMILNLPPDPKRLDIYNDLNSELVNLFRCVKERSNALLRELNVLPFHSREEFDRYKNFVSRRESYFQNIDEEIAVLFDRSCFSAEQCAELLPIFEQRRELFDVQRAADYFKRAWGSFSGTTTSFGVKPLKLPKERIVDAAKRLENVVIEHKDAMELIEERDKEDSILYCDPPYYEAEKSYAVEFSRRYHVRLWKILCSCEGYVIVSYNDHPYIRNLYKDFFILAFTRQNSMAQKVGAKYNELLMTNYDPRR
ncbi:MAG: DNA adenine methylase, partial [Oscillospiraceae bacterium]|nr:DNA adenine methylase [Oscillospiraceae bacterium]